MRQGGGSPQHQRSPRKRKTGASIIVNVTRVSAGFRIEKYKTPVSRRYETAGRCIAQSFRMIITTMATPGKISRGGVRPFADNASTSRVRENRGGSEVASVRTAVRQSIDKSMCADATKSHAGGYREEVEVLSKTFRTGRVRNMRLYASHFPRLSLHFVTALKTQPFSTFAFRIASTRSSIVICF